MSPKRVGSPYAEAVASCACNNLRRASRAITQLFDQTLEPSGLRSTQFVILLEIAAAGTATAPELARRMVMDRSTMQRNLQPLLKRELVAVGPNGGRRSRSLKLTARGRRSVETAVPLWKRAQSSFVLQLGEERWQILREDLSAVVVAARAEGSPGSSRSARTAARSRRR